MATGTRYAAVGKVLCLSPRRMTFFPRRINGGS